MLPGQVMATVLVEPGENSLGEIGGHGAAGFSCSQGSTVASDQPLRERCFSLARWVMVLDSAMGDHRLRGDGARGPHSASEVHEGRQ